MSILRRENPAMYTLSVWACHLSDGDRPPTHWQIPPRDESRQIMSGVNFSPVSFIGVDTCSSPDFSWFSNENVGLLLFLLRESPLRSSGPSFSSWTTWRISPSPCKCTTSPTVLSVKVKFGEANCNMMAFNMKSKVIHVNWFYICWFVLNFLVFRFCVRNNSSI